ncbi:hypothetical protein DDZ13_05655 [Coraliomargarita sinensis]|uniref:DUF2851 domain-containing protein n=1 Tax=Coraliomargarita sinensis TaxID=2174842 RepID=A0A317ZKD9_9BACT|nr:DUF2851 family protein [Coraliomargarita sinensis]PXA04657.1 hypothetical protein DDZ13_05655 [Coraliomargarita sinensis]
MPTIAVQEVQGLYGPFSISEKIIQKIWLQGDFYKQDLKTVSGKRLKIKDPGHWNMNEGPDFKEARFEIDGDEWVGDVEIHFYPNDWFHHEHDKNPNFGKVVLHVVLYAGTTQGWEREYPMESLVLLPLLERDLEEYAMEAALLDLEQVNELEWFERLMEKSLSERKLLLEQLAVKRWRQKADYARKRLERTDWAGCCHESTLDVLGFARNRSTMHRIASRYTIADFAGSLDTDELYEAYREEWKLSGCRPANHPKLRLKQYARICQANPDWPDKLRQQLSLFSTVDEKETGAFRKAAGTKERQAQISEDVFQNIIGTKRLNSLLSDAIFPLAKVDLKEDYMTYWQHWYPGDYPDAFSRFHRQAGFSAARIPMSHGMMQGILALFASKGEALDGTS